MLLRKLCGEHTIDLDLLPDAPLVLDVGCRTFNFTNEILELRPRARVVAVDPGPDIEPPADSRIFFLRAALMETRMPCVWLKPAGCESVTSMTPVDGWDEVPVIRFWYLLQEYGRFDLIKFDCEGAEFGILENWPARCADQINIEFHDNRKSTDGKGLPQSYFDGLMAGPLKDYRVIQNEPDSTGTHADALLVLAGTLAGS